MQEPFLRRNFPLVIASIAIVSVCLVIWGSIVRDWVSPNWTYRLSDTDQCYELYKGTLYGPTNRENCK